MGAMSALDAEQRDERQQQDEPEPTETEMLIAQHEKQARLVVELIEYADHLKWLIEKQVKELIKANEVYSKGRANPIVSKIDSDIPW